MARPRQPRRGQAAQPQRRLARGSAGRGAAGRKATTWTFGDLPELLELESPDGEVIVGFPALVDRGDAVELTVFDEPALAARRHREGIRRLFMLALAEPIQFFEREVKKNNRLELLFTTLPENQPAARHAVGADRRCRHRPQLPHRRACPATQRSSPPASRRAGRASR